ncbi:MAG: acyl-CoA synthetase [Halieaceae bacterium]|jgi:3-oxocholest-4-en-26-oate---CoA ligase|nr:acyl-CoA synthetase [Halieaceae bacterium]
MKWHFADIWETIADAIPEKPALAHGKTRRTWGQYEDRAARLAQAFVDSGLQADSKAAILAYNSPEYIEAQFAIFKFRGVPINVNYRYFESELIYLLENSDSEAIIFQAQFADRLAAIRDQLPAIKLFVEIDDGSGAHLDGATRYEEAIASSSPMPRIERSEDDIYMLYTGGTTGMPKGVMYTHGDFSAGILFGYDARGVARPTNGEEFQAAVRGLHEAGAALRSVPGCPLMHGTGMWLGAMCVHHLGGCVVTFDNSHFDPHQLWQLVQDEKLTDVVIVGDAFAKPMLKALDRAKADGNPYDLSSIVYMISSGVMFTTEVKRGLLEHGNFAIFDAMGSTEGSMGSSIMTRESPVSETAEFVMNETTKVFTEDGREVEPGSGEVGMIANGGFAPVGYYKDPTKSAVTFKEINGHRYSFPGDHATIAADGTLVLLGRGSMCINTGGEKVFPEEVEEVLKSHPDVYDCLVVGVDDERFGERVIAVTSFSSDQTPDQQALIEWMHGRLAGYKLPREVIYVPEVQRAPNGKADYKWAKQVAVEQAGQGSGP